MVQTVSASSVRGVAKTTLRHLGVEDQARQLFRLRTARGRRGLRDDHQLAYFMTAILRRDSNCVDVGAHSGAILEQIVRLAPNGSHLAFEPIPALAGTLRDRFPKVEIHDCALSDVDGETTFHIADRPELSGIRQRDWLNAGYDSIKVSVCTLDQIVSSDHRVDFLKIDVEGAQVLVLRGAERILSSNRPAIWIEHGDRSARAHGTTSEDLWELLSGHGYNIWTADGEGPLDRRSFLATDNNELMWTFMAHC